MLQVLKRNWAGCLFALALLFAAGLAIYAGRTFRLDDTRLTVTAPSSYTSDWFCTSQGGSVLLYGPSRGEAGANGAFFSMSHVLPDVIAPDDCIAIETKNEQLAAVIGERVVYSYGADDETAFGWEFGAVWHIIPLPQDAAGQTLTLSFTPHKGRTGESAYPILYGCRNALVIQLFLQNAWSAVACILMFVIAACYLCSALLHFARQDERGAGMLYFSAFVFLCGVWGTADALLLQFVHTNKSISYLLFNTSFYLLPIPFALFMGTTCPAYRKLFTRSAAVITAYALLRIVLYLLGALDFETWLFLIHLAMAFLIVASLWATFLPELRGRRKPQDPLGLVAIAVLVVAEAAALVSFYVFDRLDLQRAGYASGFYVGIFLYAVVLTFAVFRKNTRLFRRAVQAELVEQHALTDELTGLLSSRGFDETAPILLRAHPDRKHFIVDFDVNFFEQFNAVNGFAAGNELLLRIRDALRRGVRDGELLARLEADHFVLLLCGDSLDAVTARIRASDAKFRAPLMENRVLLSYGVIEVTEPTASITALRNRAAMAKRTVKGNYQETLAVYDKEFHDRQLAELSVASHFDETLASGEIRPFYQPKIDVQTGRIVGAEALVRRVLPDGTVIPPSALVPPLESRGLIGRLDLYIFESVCRFLSGRLADGLPCVPISVNFSRAHLYEPDFAERLLAIAKTHGVPCSMLEIELTESMFLVNRALLDGVMHALRENGFAVSIDDFGSGYSSLNMLGTVQVDVIKIDKSFLDNIEDSRRTRIVLNNVLRLAWDLQIPTVAEGVETRKQLAFLQEHRCTIAQGFYFSKPLPEQLFVAKYLSV